MKPVCTWCLRGVCVQENWCATEIKAFKSVFGWRAGHSHWTYVPSRLNCRPLKLYVQQYLSANFSKAPPLHTSVFDAHATVSGLPRYAFFVYFHEANYWRQTGCFFSTEAFIRFKFLFHASATLCGTKIYYKELWLGVVPFLRVLPALRLPYVINGKLLVCQYGCFFCNSINFSASRNVF